MQTQPRKNLSIVIVVLLTAMLAASQAAAQGQTDVTRAGQSAVGLTVLSSTISAARVLGMPEQIQAAVIEVAATLDGDTSEAQPADSDDDELMAADADRQSALESEAFEALDRGEPAETSRSRNVRRTRDTNTGDESRGEEQASADLGSRSEPKTVEGIIERHHDEIVSCYQQRLSDRPDLAGSVTVKFTVETDGSVVAPVIETSSLGDDAVESCITRMVGQLSFPEPVSQKSTIWKFPFQFRPAK